MTAGAGGASRWRALVVEDEWPARTYLIELLAASRMVDVVASVATEDEARQVLAPGGIEVDLAFVDIHLAASADRAGLAIVRELARKKGAPLFVLATALKQHAAEAFDLDVVDYLLKPFSAARVNECLARAERRRARPATAAPARVVARTRKGLVFLRPGDVRAFEARDRLTLVHLPPDSYGLDLSLSAIEATLGTEGWLRVHRNWLVNVEHVSSLERGDLGNTLVLYGDRQGGELRVPVSRDRSQAVREFLLGRATGVRR